MPPFLLVDSEHRVPPPGILDVALRHVREWPLRGAMEVTTATEPGVWVLEPTGWGAFQLIFNPDEEESAQPAAQWERVD